MTYVYEPVRDSSNYIQFSYFIQS